MAVISANSQSFLKEYAATWKSGKKITGISIIAFGGFADGVNAG